LSPRTGRPKGENPIFKSLTIRLDTKTEKILNKYCEENQVSRAEAIRRGIHLIGQQKK